MTISKWKYFLCIHIVTCIYIIETACVLLNFTNKENLYIGSFLSILRTHMISWLLKKGAPLEATVDNKEV